MLPYIHGVPTCTWNGSGILRNAKQYHTTCYTVIKRDTVIQTRSTETYTRGTVTCRGYLTRKQVIFRRGKSPFSTNGSSSYREMSLTSYDSMVMDAILLDISQFGKYLKGYHTFDWKTAIIGYNRQNYLKEANINCGMCFKRRPERYNGQVINFSRQIMLVPEL